MGHLDPFQLSILICINKCCTGNPTYCGSVEHGLIALSDNIQITTQIISQMRTCLNDYRVSGSVILCYKDRHMHV